MTSEALKYYSNQIIKSDFSPQEDKMAAAIPRDDERT